MRHLIFEGPELSGKSWIMSQVYDYLESNCNTGSGRLDGCHWFNCDIGVYGGPEASDFLSKYCEIFQILAKKNLIIEKFYLADKVYRVMNGSAGLDYSAIEKKLYQLEAKMIVCLLPNDPNKIAARLEDRIRIYPHYARIAKQPEWYLEQQYHYLGALKNCPVPYLLIETDQLPDNTILPRILNWGKD